MQGLSPRVTNDLDPPSRICSRWSHDWGGDNGKPEFNDQRFGKVLP